jgi:hypothetical protein
METQRMAHDGLARATLPQPPAEGMVPELLFPLQACVKRGATGERAARRRGPSVPFA